MQVVSISRLIAAQCAWMFLFVPGWVPGTVLAEDTPRETVTVDGRVFRIPSGFTLQQVAGPGLVDRPISGALDDEGRLYVSDSSGTNDPVEKQLEERPHRIVRLEDTDGDGHYDTSVVFADQMMFPEGTLWREGSLYVAAAPQIWKLTDTNQDGVADRREVWFDGQTLTGCANDLHGPYQGPDGRIYWAKGAFATQSYPRRGKPPLVTRAAHILRAKPDGSELEPVMTGGMDNPVEVTFTMGGERLFNGTFFQQPGGGLRDGVIHAIYGGIYGKIHDPIFDPVHPWTGPDVMPVMVHLGPAAPAALLRYESDALGPGYQGNLFNACFNLHKVLRHVLTPHGATFQATTEELLGTDDLDFHPTDVIEDADGSLLIVDTGGWYKLCCPTSQLHKPDILGAIYRLQLANMPVRDDPRGKTLQWQGVSPQQFAGRLADPRPTVQRRAVRELARLDSQASLDAIASVLANPTSSTQAQCNAVWAATGMESPSAMSLLRQAMAATDETVRQAAIHGISLHRDASAIDGLVKILSGTSIPNRRAAAEALGRIGDPRAIPALIQGLNAPGDDRILQHSLTYALIEIGDVNALQQALVGSSGSPQLTEQARQSVLTAWDQVPGSTLTADAVVEALGAPDASTRRVAAWIAGRHPDWAPQLVQYFERAMDEASPPGGDPDLLAAQIAGLASAGEIQTLIADRASGRTGSEAAQHRALRAMALAHLDPCPAEWIAAVAQAAKQGDLDSARLAIAAAQTLATPADRSGQEAVDKAAIDLDASLRQVGGDAKVPPLVRLEALAATPTPVDASEVPLIAFLFDQLRREEAVQERGLAVRSLARAKLSDDQLLELAEAVPHAGPLELDPLLAAFVDCRNEQVGARLLASLQASDAKASLRVDRLQAAIGGFGPEIQAGAIPLFQALNVDAASQNAKVEALLDHMSGGDVRRGQAVFHDPKSVCISCHQMGYAGGAIGPDLTRIGEVRSERDLLEAILYPNLSFVRSYEPVVVITNDGRTFSGILKKDAPDEVILTLSATEEMRLPRADIEEMQPGNVSVMPSGLDQQLTEQELVDLVTFLKASK